MPFDNTKATPSPTGAAAQSLHCAARPGRRGVIQINHGLAEHAARYARFADALAAQGFHAYAHDHRGHGHTKAPDAPQGRLRHAGRRRKVIADIAAFMT